MDWRTADRWIMGEAWVGSRIQSHIDALCDDIGVRWGGSDGERRAAEYAVGQFEGAGLADPRIEEFGIETWRSDEASITVAGEESWRLDVRPCLFCPALDVSGPLVDVGYGTDDELNSVRGALDGVIALVNAGFEPFTPPTPLTERLVRLAAAGAVAAITPSPHGGRRTQHMSANDWRAGRPSDLPLPLIQTSREDGHRLARRAARGARVSVRVAAETPAATSRNAVAELPGARGPADHLVLGAHHDTTVDSFGGNDNGSGASVTLEVARLLAGLKHATGVAPGATIRFVTFGSEEQMLQGSTAFVERHHGPEPPPRLMVNLDELATGNVKGVALQFPELRPLVQQNLDSMNEGFKCHVMPQLDASGDMFPFARAGIPSAILWRWRFVGRHPDTAFGHSGSDTADKVRVRELKEYAGMLARLLLRLSHVPPEEWPRNTLDPAAIAERIKRERGAVFRTM